MSHLIRSIFSICLCPLACLFLAAPDLCADEPSEQSQPAPQSSVRPNILLIFTDDQGVNDVGCYGSEIKTPHIDSLATSGLKLNQFYAASSICTPSRFGLLTGRFAHRSEDQLTSALMFLDDEDADRGIRSHEQTFVTELQQSGYQTHLVGKWHLGHGQSKFWPTEHGFDTFFGHTGGCVDFFTCHYANRPDWYRGKTLVQTDQYATDVITDEAEKLIQSFPDRSSTPQSSKPWYLHVAYNAPHFGKAWEDKNQKPLNTMQPKPQDLQRVASIDDPLRRSFAAKVVGMDDGIGRLLKALDETDQTEDTLVIFMTDHGGDPNYGGSNLPLRGGKATLFEGGLRVPCLMRYPKLIQPATTSNEVASALDLYPTIAELAGLGPKDNLDGQSMLPILQGNKDQSHRPIVWATGSHAELGRKAWHAVRDGKWKWVQPPNKAAMLFDLSNDPNETNDVIAQFPDVAARLRNLSAAPAQIDESLMQNFRRIDPKLFVGGSPRGEEAFAALAQRGVRTIISVDGSTPQVELAKQHGLRYIHLPIGYDQVDATRTLELAKAINESSGGVYLHCHHGKHRAPAAVAVACVALGKMDHQQASELLKQAGTSPRYAGLFRSVDQTEPHDLTEIQTLKTDFKSSVEVTELAQQMVAIDRSLEHLLASLKESGDEFAEDSMLLHEHFAEALRLEEIRSWPEPQLQRMKRSAAIAQQISKASKEQLQKDPLGLIKSLQSECKNCHAEMRD
ncbi:sulfatase-like hydrolase/transferase [Stieleria sp. JC731]|uniref:sulfatase-like hydrolase/transferase n=1 Tax=Pirellulaceae TaxID=2691357 RepID=UPI001E47BA5C|nr:sulfatase-like hydrolase/transferase [Stieleria sp. JC731]MCC9598927.1 sulfatase-like hydrolase/transferase [Stieleria sp. JC731]